MPWPKGVKMSSKIIIHNEEYDIEPDTVIADAVRALGFNPSAFIFSINGTPVPMDGIIPDNTTIKAIKVASGG